MLLRLFTSTSTRVPLLFSLHLLSIWKIFSMVDVGDPSALSHAVQKHLELLTNHEDPELAYLYGSSPLSAPPSLHSSSSDEEDIDHLGLHGHDSAWPHHEVTRRRCARVARGCYPCCTVRLVTAESASARAFESATHPDASSRETCLHMGRDVARCGICLLGGSPVLDGNRVLGRPSLQTASS